jgi:DNA-binding winged helix-turn-helix (wHTH) protein/tetratricopeptide (TPR) repeat protein
MQENTRWTFAGFELDLTANVLRTNGQLVRIGAQPFRALALLVSKGGELVTRDELQKEIWGDRVHVDFDHGLSVCIGQIRAALGHGESKHIVVTCPRQGYRLGVPVTRLVGKRRPFHHKWGAAAAAAAFLAAAPLLVPSVPSHRAARANRSTSAPATVAEPDAAPRSEPSLLLTPASFLHAGGNVNPEAYALYWRGRSYYDRVAGTELVGAFPYFEKAVALSPTFALAFSGLAVAYLDRAAAGIAPAESAVRARQAAQHALALDPRSPETHVALAELSYRLDSDDGGAERAFARAMELDGRNSFVRQRYARFLYQQRRFDAALEQLRVAQELDPLSVVSSWRRANVLFVTGRYEESLAEAHRTLKLEPAHSRSFRTIGECLEAMGKYDDAVDAYLQAGQVALGQLGRVYALDKRYQEARSILAVLTRQTRQPLEEASHNGMAIASVYTGLGETAEAMRWLEKTDRDGVRLSFALRVSPQWAALRARAEFTEFLKTKNVPGT